jgi:hypothetical protein
MCYEQHFPIVHLARLQNGSRRSGLAQDGERVEAAKGANGKHKRENTLRERAHAAR